MTTCSAISDVKFMPQTNHIKTWLWNEYWIVVLNTLRPRHNGRHFADDIFKWIFLNENIWILIKISLKFVPQGPINNIPALVQIIAWRRPGDKSLSEPMMVKLPTHICVTRPQWVKVCLKVFHFRFKIRLLFMELSRYIYCRIEYITYKYMGSFPVLITLHQSHCWFIFLLKPHFHAFNERSICLQSPSEINGTDMWLNSVVFYWMQSPIHIIALTHLPLVSFVCVNELGRHRVMAWRCSVPSHYLNQCWLIVNWTPGNKVQWTLNRNSVIFSQ